MDNQSTIAIRTENGVTELDESDTGFEFSELPEGVFGFIPPWLFRTDTADIFESILSMWLRTNIAGITPSRTRSGTAVLEVHKVSSEDYYLLLYVSSEDERRFNDTSRQGTREVRAYFSPYAEYSHPVAVPVIRIHDWIDRLGDDGRYFATFRYQESY